MEQLEMLAVLLGFLLICLIRENQSGAARNVAHFPSRRAQQWQERQNL
jgi:hypothetical protein